MGSLWRWNDVDIFVQEDSVSKESYVAILKVLDSPINALQFYGAGSKVHSVKGIVIGSANINSILDDAKTGTERQFTSDIGSLGNYIIEGEVKFDRISHSGAEIDGVTYPVSTPIYTLDMKIISTTG